MEKYNIVIIGAGIIGAMTARELSKYNLSICVLEANNHVAGETTEGNSGVIHVGFDAVPGTLKAKYNIEGRLLWFNEIFPNISIHKAKVPSLIVAMKKHESKQLEMLGSYEKIAVKNEMDHIKILYDRGITNKLDPSEMKILDRDQTLKAEPNVSPNAIGSLYAPNSWAISGPEATYALMTNAVVNGVCLHLKSKVVSIEAKGKQFEIKTGDGKTITADVIINAAGHYADTLSHLAKVDTFTQTTRRGEYRVLSKTEAARIKIGNIIFKTPTIFGKGVVVAPTLTGHILVGPTALDGVPKEDTRLVTQDMFEHIGVIGKDLVPSLRLDKTERTFAGSRPICKETNDFVIRRSEKSERFIILGGMQSPALASAPAIAKRAVELVKESGALKLVPKRDFNPKYEPVLPPIV